MEEEEENMLPPFWLRTNDTLQRVENRRRRPFLQRSSSLFLNSGALILVLLVVALVFIFIVIPSILSFPSHVFRPQVVKKSWDSLNLVLVLFAIVCGFLSRNTSENTSSYEDHQSVSNGSVLEARKSDPSTPRQWYDQYSDRTSYNRLRSSSSYPDLRQESLWVSRDDRRRSYDDYHVTSYRPVSSSLDQLHHRQAWQQEPEAVLDRDAFVVPAEESSPLPGPPSESSPPEPPPPPSSPPRSTTPPEPPRVQGVKRKAKRTHQALGVQNERTTESSERNDFEAAENSRPPASTSAPPSPPSLPPLALSAYQEIEQKSGKSEKKRMVVSKEFLLTSLRRKKKKQRQKSVENFEAILSSFSSSSSLPSQAPPSRAPPPPPPPPPPSVFQNLFSSKKGKTKKVQYPISQPQPPNPPPPPPTRRPISTVINSSKTKASRPIAAHQLPSPATDDRVNRGNESPLIPIPPPPPPPPFKMPAWKFVRHGDFVRIKSNTSSRSGSPDLEESEDSGSKETSPMARSDDVAATEGGESPAHMFCRSPDVNSKADTFIARFRAGLRLEKVNSAKERKSTLGPQPNPAPDPYEE